MIQHKLLYVLCLCVGFMLGIILLQYPSDRDRVSSVFKFGDSINKDNTLLLSEDSIHNYSSTKNSADNFDDRIIQFQKNEKQMSRDLFEKVKILCWVMHEPKRKEYRDAIMDTWGRRCNLILFVIGNESSSAKEDIPTVTKVGPNAQLVEFQMRDHYDILWLKTKTAFKYITKIYKAQYDWIYKMDDDTFIIMENLRLFLKDKSLTNKSYYGCQYSTNAPKGYSSGGPGYIMSSFVAKKFVESLSMPGCPPDNSGAEDVNVAICLSLINIYPADTRDSHGRFRFSPFIPEMVIDRASLPARYNWWYSFQAHTMKEGFECCSDTAIAYHYVTPSFMRVMEYLIYYLHPFSTRDIS